MKKKTKLHPLIVLVCPVLVAMLTYFINHFIEYGGDDYSYIIVGRILRQGILPFLQQNYFNWLNDNGRFLVHLLDSLFLIAPIELWRVFNSVLLGLLVYFFIKLIDVNQILVGIATSALVLAMHIDMTRQSVYWITGSFNYLYPLTLVFAIWFVLLRCKWKVRGVLLCVIGFLAGASVEQASLMAIGVVFLYLVKEYICNKVLQKEDVAAFIFTIAGACTLFFAPATWRRIGIETTQPLLTIMNQSIKIIVNTLYSDYFVVILVLLIASSTLYLLNARSTRNKILILISVVSSSMLIYFNIQSSVNLKILIISMLCIILYCALLLLATLQKLWKVEPERFFMAFTILVVGVGSIAMMIVSPVLGPRNFLFAYFALGFYCIFILSQIIKKTSIGVVCALVAIAIINYSVTLEGYRANHIVYVENNKLISEWVNTNRKSTLIQYKLIDDRFAWSLPYVSEFHERVYKVWIIEYKGFEIEWVDFAKPM